MGERGEPADMTNMTNMANMAIAGDCKRIHDYF